VSRPGILLRNHAWLVPLLLLAIAVGVNVYLQDNFFMQRVLNGNLRVMLPLMILAVGQAIVILAGGIDLSVGAMVSLVNTVFVTLISADSGGLELAGAMLVGVGVGALAGAVNGLCVAVLRLQPIVTTYATSFIFAGLALAILPRPGGSVPRDLTRFYRDYILEVPVAAYGIALLIILWLLLRRTRFGHHLYAGGGNDEAARAPGVRAGVVPFGSRAASGARSALAAPALTMSIGSGNARIGDDMTLSSIVAVVLGGTRLAGGRGGAIGAVIGVAILSIIRNIISFAGIPSWYQTLVDALIILAALAGPGLVYLIRRQRNDGN